MRTIHVSVGHDDDFVVTQLFDVEFVAANSGAKRHDKVADFLAAKHPVKPRTFDVQDFTTQRQNRLCLAITSRLCRSTSAVTLDQKDFGFGWVFFRTVLQFTGQVIHIHRRLAPCQLARFAGRLAGQCGLDDFANDDLGLVRVFFEPLRQLFVHQTFNSGAHF